MERNARWMLLLLSVAVSIAASSSIHAEEPPLRPDTLLNWLRIIDIPDAKLLYAADVQGRYIAIKADADGDIVLCEYEHAGGERPAVRTRSMDVLNSKGESLLDLKSEKKSPDTVKIEYQREAKVGPLSTSTSATVAYSRGVMLPLRKHDEAAVTVKLEDTTTGESRVLLSQRIELPAKPMAPK